MSSVLMGEIRLACHTEGWGDENFIRAVSEIAGCGYQGIETTPNVVEAYEDRPFIRARLNDDVSHGVGRLESGYDSLQFGEQVEGVEGHVISNEVIPGAL